MYFEIPCLKEALVLRQSIEDGQSAVSNIIVQSYFDYARNATENICEMATLEQLEQVTKDDHRTE